MPLPIWLIDAAKPYPFHTHRERAKFKGEGGKGKGVSELDTCTHRLGHFLRELPANEITTIAATAASACASACAAPIGIFIVGAAHTVCLQLE